MSSYARLIESIRRTRKTVYLVGGLYIALGFVVATVTAIQGDLLGTFLGFLIISGALSVAIIARTALLVLVRVAHIEVSLEGFSSRLDEWNALGQKHDSSDGGERSDVDAPSEPVLRLPDSGAGHAETLAAATLDRDVYPRLAPATVPRAGEIPAHARASKSSVPGNGVRRDDAPIGALLQRWKAALAHDDLMECRSVLSAVLSVADSQAITLLRKELYRLENRVERALRNQFTRHVRNRDYAAALETGERICSLLGERPVAVDFQRLRPVLVRRAENSALASSLH